VLLEQYCFKLLPACRCLDLSHQLAIRWHTRVLAAHREGDGQLQLAGQSLLWVSREPDVMAATCNIRCMYCMIKTISIKHSIMIGNDTLLLDKLLLAAQAATAPDLLLVLLLFLPETCLLPSPQQKQLLHHHQWELDQHTNMDLVPHPELADEGNDQKQVSFLGVAARMQHRCSASCEL